MEQQQARHVTGVPARPVEYFVVAAETGLIRQPHDAQRLGDGAFAWCQDGAADQNQDMLPDRRGEARSENCQPRHKNCWHCWMGGRRFDAVVCHRIRRIESPQSCKSLSAQGIRLRRLCGWLLGYDLTANGMKLRKVELSERKTAKVIELLEALRG